MTLTLKTMNQFVCMTLRLMVLHKPTRFGNKMSAVRKISSEQTFTDILNLCCDLYLDHSNPIFPQDTPVYDAILSNQVWLQTGQPIRRCKNSHILII